MGKRGRKQAKDAQKEAEEIPAPSFASLILMLSTGALQHLGYIANPLTKKQDKNLALARHTIDTLEILKEKTEGNLEEEEEKLLAELLYDLRMKFVEVSGEES